MPKLTIHGIAILTEPVNVTSTSCSDLKFLNVATTISVRQLHIGIYTFNLLRLGTDANTIVPVACPL